MRPTLGQAPTSTREECALGAGADIADSELFDSRQSFIRLPDGQITSTSDAVNPSIPSRKNIPLALSGKSLI